MIGRCDSGGGLSALTREIHRHLRPERTLLLDLGDRGRGECVPDDYIHGDVYRCEWLGGLSSRAIEWVTAPGVEALFTAETFYDDRVLVRAKQNGLRAIVYAMPELAPWATTAFDRPRPSAPRPEIIVPTMWREDTLPDSTLLPFPVARDRLPFRARTKVKRLYHVTGSAMRDRNATDLLLSALPNVVEPCHLTIRSERPVNVLPGGAVDVEVISERAPSYFESVPDDADVLLMPRRYGGLSLPLQECASLGIPAVTLSTDPYSALPFVHALSPTRSEPVRMKGGTVECWSADPRALANLIDLLVREPQLQVAASLAADEWAECHAWHGPLGAEWCRALNAGCAQEAAA